MGQGGVVNRKKFKLKKLPIKCEPNSMYYIKDTDEYSIKIYVTDINGIPKELESENGQAQTIINTDGNLTITGQDVIKINASNQLLDSIDSKLSSGDSISELNNDVGFITLGDIPPSTDAIEKIKKNGVELLIVNREVDIEVPTKHSDLILDDGTNPHRTTKNDVGLNNVDNTSDINKPISTVTQNALNLKLDKVSFTSNFKEVYAKAEDGSQIMIPVTSLGDTNKIEKIKRNGIELPITNKEVDIIVPELVKATSTVLGGIKADSKGNDQTYNNKVKIDGDGFLYSKDDTYRQVFKALYPNVTGPQSDLNIGSIIIPAYYFKLNQLIRITIKPWYENPGNINGKVFTIVNREHLEPLYLLWGTTQPGGYTSNGYINHSFIDSQKRLIQRSGSGMYPFDIGNVTASTLSRIPTSMSVFDFNQPISFDIYINITATDTLREVAILIELFDNG